jgi:ABC-type transporter Mla subunit MlaD
VIRRLVIAGSVLLAAAAALVLAGAGGAGPEPYRVAAIFDNADFLVKGQTVKIAGAESGQVAEVRLTPDRKARVVMEVRRDFGPFRDDGSCSIRPESLIGEKFVDCEPGTPRGKPLPEQDGVPTLALERNHSPVDLDLVFATLRMPYRQRLTILVNELGVGLAGRPRELNEAIRRANPALQRVNRVLAILDRDRRTLGNLIDASDRVLAQLAARRGEVAGFIDRADRVAGAVASRRGDLDLAIRRLPPMLEELEPAANDLAALTEDARPVANDLRAAAGPVRDLLGDFGPLSEAARPTLVALKELSATGRRAVRSTLPVARDLRPVARRLPATLALTRRLTESLRDQGAVDNLMRFLYYAAAATARFDRHSHIVPSYQVAGTCQQYAMEPVAGCSARFQGAGRQKARRREGEKADGSQVAGRRSQERQRGRRTSAAPPRASTPPSAPPTPLPPAIQPPAAPDAVQDVLDYLLAP